MTRCTMISLTFRPTFSPISMVTAGSTHSSRFGMATMSARTVRSLRFRCEIAGDSGLQRVLRLRPGYDFLGDLRVGDVDGDGRPEVVALEGFGDRDDKIDIGVRVFGGRDGALRWRWKPDMGRSIAAPGPARGSLPYRR